MIYGKTPATNKYSFHIKAVFKKINKKKTIRNE